MMPDAPKAPAVDLQEVALGVTASIGEPTSATDVERVMASLQSVSSFWETIALSGRTAAQVAAILRALAAEDVVTFETEKVALTPGGLALAWQHSLVPRKLYRCPHCEGRGLTLNIFQRTQTRYEKVLDEWRSRGGLADADALTPTSVIALVAFLADRGDLMGKEILIAGDGALTSVALALSGFPKRVVTLERDQGRAAFLRETVARDRLKLEVVEADGDELPAGLAGRFGTVVLPEIKEGVAAAAAPLQGPGAALVGLWSHADRPLSALARLEDEAHAHGLVLTDFIRDFAASDVAQHLHYVREDGPEVFRLAPVTVWRKPAVVRFEGT